MNEPKQSGRRFLKLTLQYDGARYAGWQVQPDKTTIQGAVELAIKKVTGESVRVVASGRTDAGVHALGQVASVAVSTPLDSDVLLRALNANLPNAICLLDVAEAGDGFHAIRDATRKRYRYLLHDGPLRDVFLGGRVWQIFRRLDCDAMREAAKLLSGTHDFAAFEAAGSERTTSVRTVREIVVRRQQAEQGGGSRSVAAEGVQSPSTQLILFEVEADGFLYNMVRNIVGTLVEVGKGKRPPAWVAEVLASRDRKQAGATALPQGLYLVQVWYD